MQTKKEEFGGRGTSQEPSNTALCAGVMRASGWQSCFDQHFSEFCAVSAGWIFYCGSSQVYFVFDRLEGMVKNQSVAVMSKCILMLITVDLPHQNFTS